MSKFNSHPMKGFDQIAHELCQMALKEARSLFHPLVQDIEVNRLGQRNEFLQGFKSALEQQTARNLAALHPSILSIFSYDVSIIRNPEDWDGCIHLLAKVPGLLRELKLIESNLDNGLVNSLKQLNWQRFKRCKSVLEIQQVTTYELRHGIGYGAMFHAVYTVPNKVWPLGNQAA